MSNFMFLFSKCIKRVIKFSKGQHFWANEYGNTFITDENKLLHTSYFISIRTVNICTCILDEYIEKYLKYFSLQ